MLSDNSLNTGSIMASINTLIPPDHAHNNGFSKTKSLNKPIQALF